MRYFVYYSNTIIYSKLMSFNVKVVCKQRVNNQNERCVYHYGNHSDYHDDHSGGGSCGGSGGGSGGAINILLFPLNVFANFELINLCMQEIGFFTRHISIYENTNGCLETKICLM